MSWVCKVSVSLITVQNPKNKRVKNKNLVPFERKYLFKVDDFLLIDKEGIINALKDFCKSCQLNEYKIL